MNQSEPTAPLGAAEGDRLRQRTPLAQFVVQTVEDREGKFRTEIWREYRGRWWLARGPYHFDALDPALRMHAAQKNRLLQRLPPPPAGG